MTNRVMSCRSQGISSTASAASRLFKADRLVATATAATALVTTVLVASAPEL